MISTHTPLAGRDSEFRHQLPQTRNFNSHAPCGARPYFGLLKIRNLKFQLTRPLRGATRKAHRPIYARQPISTHTPLAGRDPQGTPPHLRPSTDFNSHAPCGARRVGLHISIKMRKFQLTRPSRGATRAARIVHRGEQFQLTRPLRGATTKEWDSGGTVGISTHTPLAGRDVISVKRSKGSYISTHTPLAGRD